MNHATKSIINEALRYKKEIQRSKKGTQSVIDQIIGKYGSTSKMYEKFENKFDEIKSTVKIEVTDIESVVNIPVTVPEKRHEQIKTTKLGGLISVY